MIENFIGKNDFLLMFFAQNIDFEAVLTSRQSMFWVLRKMYTLYTPVLLLGPKGV